MKGVVKMISRELIEKKTMDLIQEVEYLENLALAGHFPLIEKAIRKEMLEREKAIAKLEKQVGILHHER